MHARAYTRRGMRRSLAFILCVEFLLGCGKSGSKVNEKRRNGGARGASVSPKRTFCGMCATPGGTNSVPETAGRNKTSTCRGVGRGVPCHGLGRLASVRRAAVLLAARFLTKCKQNGQKSDKVIPRAAEGPFAFRRKMYYLCTTR